MRPSDPELQALLLGMSTAQIAEVFGAAQRTVQGWVADMRVRSGEAAPARTAAREKARSKNEIAKLAEEMLDRAVEIVRDDTFQNPRDRIAQGKLALQVHSALIERVASAPRDVPTLGREELKAKVRAATASAARKHLRVVGET